MIEYLLLQILQAFCINWSIISLFCLISYINRIFCTMNRSYSDEDFHADRMINKSCNQKIQDDTEQSEKVQTKKFKTSKSQNQLKTIDGEEALQAISEQWRRNQQKRKRQGDNRVETHRSGNRNSPTPKRNPQTFQVGRDLVYSQEISIEEELLRSDQHTQKNQSSRRQNIQQMRIIQQRRKKQLQQLITLNILILGKSGVGKSSFIECFSNKNYENSPVIRSKTEIMNIVTVRNECDNFQVKLIDVPGYEELKLQQYIKDVENLINKRFEAHLNKISDRKALRSQIKDERIHCCLYFLSGPWICEADWIIMKKIENITNIIPIVAKGDTFTTRQIKQFKKKIFERNKMMNINWFSIEEYLRQYHKDKLKTLNQGTFGKSPPFVITCCTEKQYNQTTRKHEFVRDFRWGKCELNNEAHNDFKFLKSLLLYYLSDLLIKSTDLTMRSFQQKMIENRYKAQSSRDEPPQQELDAQRNSNTSQSQEIVKQEGQFIEMIKSILPLGLTLAGLIGVYFWIKKK